MQMRFIHAVHHWLLAENRQYGSHLPEGDISIEMTELQILTLKGVAIIT